MEMEEDRPEAGSRKAIIVYNQRLDCYVGSYCRSSESRSYSVQTCYTFFRDC